MAPLTEKSGNARKASSLELQKAANHLTKTAQSIGRKRKSDADQENNTAPNKKSKSDSTLAKTSSAKTKTKASSSSSGGTGSKKAKAPSKKQSKDDELAKYDVSQIHLDGEEKDAVPVYDTCSDIRTKITMHQRNAPSKFSSSAALIREFTACIAGASQSSKPVGMSASGLKTFMKQNGHNGGASSPIFYSAYVYFEKLRIKQDKQKSKKREEMEQVWGKKGMDLSADSSKPMFLHFTEHVTCDKYGKMEIVSVR